MTRTDDNRGVMMRAFRYTMRGILPLLALAALLTGSLAGCGDTARLIDDDDELSWGPPIEGDYATVYDRARGVVLRKYPLGFDPDRTKEDEGDLWTLWRHDKSVFYRGTVRRRARVKVEQLGQGKVRVGVAVVEQINDNIDNPTVIDEAKWVRMHRVPEQEELIRESIEQTWNRFEPSAQWKEKHRTERRTGLRPDLVDSTDDVTLEDHKPQDILDPPKITGQSEYGAGQTDPGSHTRKKKPEDE